MGVDGAAEALLDVVGGVVALGAVSTFAADEFKSTSGVLEAEVVCETLLRFAVKGSRKVGGRRRESRQQARLAARERNILID